MKCKYCDGTGEEECSMCHGTKEVLTATGKSPCPKCCLYNISHEMTNDEWRRTCSTEEFIKFIRQLLYESYKPEERIVRKKLNEYFAKKYNGNVERTWEEAVKEWLKETHHVK